jgi:tetratricopeptide (TPR) repeat protein
VKDIVTKFKELIDKIRLERSKRGQNEVNEPFSISIFQTNTYEEHFIYSQLLIHILLRLKSMHNDKKKLIALCREKYQEIDHEFKLIQEFENDYSLDKALDWYMKDSFLYRILNRVLRLENIDILFLFRFLIQDIRQIIKQNKCKSPIRVYRSQLMTREEINLLENSMDSLISINSFLSTSICRELALVFLNQASSSSDLERVLFEIDADPSFASIKPFGFIKCNNYVRQTEEVLFTLGSVFRLINIQQQSDGMWIIKLTLCAENDHQLKEIFKPFTINKKNEQLNILSFGNLLRKMDEIDEAEKFFLRLLRELPDNYPIVADCYYSLACIALEKKIDDLSFNWHKKSLEIKLQILKEDNLSLADSYNSIGQLYLKKSDYEQALSSYLRALNITMQANGENHLDVARCYTNIGGVYQKQEDYSRALDCHEKALAIHQKNFSIDHSDLGISHNNIAIIYSCRGQNDLALEHYNISLKILKNTLPPLHPELAVCYCGLGLIFEQKDQLENALSYYEKTAVIYRQTLSSTHPDVIQIEQHIKRILSKLS